MVNCNISPTNLFLSLCSSDMHLFALFQKAHTAYFIHEAIVHTWPWGTFPLSCVIVGFTFISCVFPSQIDKLGKQEQSYIISVFSYRTKEVALFENHTTIFSI